MNSDEERELLEEFGWSYDYIAREWRSPGGHVLTLDDLMEFSQDEEWEQEIVALIKDYGRRREAS